MHQFNLDAWKNIDLIFPEGGTTLDGVWYDNEEIRFANMPLIQSTIVKPIRDIPENQVLVSWYDNGNMDRRTTYSTYPPNLIDNIPPLNVYAQKIYNTFIANLQASTEKETLIDDFESTYSSL